MRSTLSLALSFDRPVKLLLVNQLTINVGFYMLMPYLAGHLSGTLALPAALVGLVLGVRNLSQQGMFLVGGTARRPARLQADDHRRMRAAHRRVPYSRRGRLRFSCWWSPRR